MLTLLDLKTLEFEASSTILDCSRDIQGLINTRSPNIAALKLQQKELERLKRRKRKAQDEVAFYKLIHSYLSSGVQMGGIKSQRNELLVKLSSLKDREEVEGINRKLTDKENKKVISAFETKYKVKKLRTQLKTLNFILK